MSFEDPSKSIRDDKGRLLNSSTENGLYHSNSCCWHYFSCPGKRTLFAAAARKFDWGLGWLPDFGRCRVRAQHATSTSMSTLFESYEEANPNNHTKAIISIQAAVGEEQLATGMALVIFAQSLGPAIVLVVCNVIFNSSLKSQLQDKAPHTDSAAVIRAGATGFRAIVQRDDLPGVLAAYAVSVDRVFYFVAAVAAACIVVLWGMGWHDLRAKDNKVEEGAVQSKQIEKWRGGKEGAMIGS